MCDVTTKSFFQSSISKFPIFFPSVSSIKTARPPAEYISLLSSASLLTDVFLVSAYDLARIDDPSTIISYLQKTLDEKRFVLMDSGNYESFWKTSEWSAQSFHEVLSNFPCSFAFSYDNQSPPDNLNSHLINAISAFEADMAAAPNRLIIPILHENKNNLPELCCQFSANTGIDVIAVAERRLGTGIFERIDTIQKIRQSLNETGREIVLHLLGTGNPISIALYSIAGANSFDGLEWCQTVIDYETAQLFHLSQSDFFSSQTPWVEEGFGSTTSPLLHNLDFYKSWMTRLQKSIAEGTQIDFCRMNFPKSIFTSCQQNLGWK